jgi:hypothetical protein
VRDSWSPLKYFIPFVKTIANIFKAGIRKSPLGSVNMLYRSGERNAIDMKWNGGWSYTRQDIGATHAAEQLIAWGLFVALRGFVEPDKDDGLPTMTGTVPFKGTTKGERDLAYRTAPPMSIRIGKEWYSYGRIEPFATALGVMVDGLNSVKHAENGGDYTKAMGAMIEHLTAQLKDKTFARGIGDFLNAIEDGSTMMDWAGNFAVSWVPNLIRVAAREADDSIREQKVWGRGDEWGARFADRLEYKALPIAANAPPPKVDLWGRDIQKDTGENPATDWLYRMISPARMQPAGDVVSVDRMLVNWNNAHPDETFAPAPPPPVWQKSIKTPEGTIHKTVAMSDEEYHKFLRESGKMALQYAVAEGLNYATPTRDDLQKVESALEKSRHFWREKLWEAHTSTK